MDVPVRELKNHLSEYLRRVQAGEEVHVTLRGRRIARLVAEGESAKGAVDSSGDDPLQRIHLLPGVRPGDGRPIRGAPNPTTIPEGEQMLSDIVREQRGPEFE